MLREQLSDLRAQQALEMNQDARNEREADWASDWRMSRVRPCVSPSRKCASWREFGGVCRSVRRPRRTVSAEKREPRCALREVVTRV